MLSRCGRWRCVKVSSFRTGNRHFAQARQVSSISDCTSAELPDMHLTYEAAGCNLPTTLRFYAEQYRTRHTSLKACSRE